ncbi:MAG: preprotein translocase subunit SecA [Chloroflexi bacterium]|nr:preprotein translocase subunit SecA [Chloroflexota bacterium]
MILKALNRMLGGDVNDRTLRRLQPRVADINALEAHYQALDDDALRATTAEFRERLTEGETLDDLLPDAFAAVREAGCRALGMRHFDVQLIGGMVLHEGKIAEMKTGEGKTLVATLPLYLNALTGKGVHLVTVNDYLARRDGGWMGRLFHALGMTTGVIIHEYSALFDPEFVDEAANQADVRLVHWRPVSRTEAYAADITYGTNNEFGFDYLRDNMVHDARQLAQRPLHYAIVDEVDNILIDEARTPLIISGQAAEATDRYYQFAQLVRQLRPTQHYEIDEKQRAVTLTEDGIHRVERLLNIPTGESLYDERYYELTHYLENALKADVIFKRDRDYMVRAGEVIIIDEFTGRAMEGRRYSEGLHQAIEAKENVKVKRESVTLATITFQNYFRMYEKLAGMTGTAATEAEEFHRIYGLEVVIIPTNLPMVRGDYADQVYKTEVGKYRAVVNEIADQHQQGRPVLVGTTSIEKSEYLSGLLKRQGVKHEVLNAKYHEREATIVANAGQAGAVTIATNMAGRGTDIKLGEGVREAGGLHIVGTERHEARRIDNQLRGRAGRQGDPGSSRFFISLEDDLMRRFGSDRIAGIMDRLGVDEDQPIEAGIISKSIESAQTKVEGFNFDLRKHVVQYDDVMNKQREVIYVDRRRIIAGEDMRERIQGMISSELTAIVDRFTPTEPDLPWDLEAMQHAIGAILPPPPDFADYLTDEVPAIKDRLEEWAETTYEEKETALGADVMRQLERLVMLHVIDRLWTEYLTEMEDLRQGIGLVAYGQRDPLVQYKAEAYNLFEALKKNIEHDIAHTIYRVTLVQQPPTPVAGAVHTNRQSEVEPPAGPRRAAGGGRAAAATAARPRTAAKVGRNDPCPCGSGKKYKHCHGA